MPAKRNSPCTRTWLCCSFSGITSIVFSFVSSFIPIFETQRIVLWKMLGSNILGNLLIISTDSYVNIFNTNCMFFTRLYQALFINTSNTGTSKHEIRFRKSFFIFSEKESLEKIFFDDPNNFHQFRIYLINGFVRI